MSAISGVCRIPQGGIRLVRLLSSGPTSTCVRALVRRVNSPFNGAISVFAKNYRFYHADSDSEYARHQQESSAVDGDGDYDDWSRQDQRRRQPRLSNSRSLYDDADEDFQFDFSPSFSRNQRRGGGGGFRGGRRPRDSDFYSGAQRPSKSQPGQSSSSSPPPPVTRPVYQPSERVLQRDVDQVAEWRRQHSISVTEISSGGENDAAGSIPAPLTQFADFSLPECVGRAIERHAFSEPTPVQAQGWPLALSGRDMVAVAQTGSGKTLAYVLPAIVHIDRQEPLRRGDGPLALILAPTRELAQQISSVVAQYGRDSRVRCTCVFGGASRAPQQQALYRGSEVVVATPGRLLDFLADDSTSLHRCSYLVLDEADRMLDMGFEPQIRQIISQMPPERQTLMWSATWPKEIRQLAGEFLQSPVLLNVGSLQLSANHDITQLVHVCQSSEKLPQLISILDEIHNSGHAGKILVFCATKRVCDTLTMRVRSWSHRLSSSDAFSCHAIHGDKSQRARDDALHQFRNAKRGVLLATDVAARGLDVADITHVINFDTPTNIESYIHRIGRTGRCGRRGTAHSLLTEDDAAIVGRQLLEVLQEAGQPVSEQLQLLVDNSSRGAGNSRRSYSGSGGGGYRRSGIGYDGGYRRGGGSWRRNYRRSSYDGYMNKHRQAYNTEDMSSEWNERRGGGGGRGSW